MCHYWSHHGSLEEGEFQGAGTGAALVAAFFTLLLFLLVHWGTCTIQQLFPLLSRLLLPALTMPHVAHNFHGRLSASSSSALPSPRGFCRTLALLPSP